MLYTYCDNYTFNSIPAVFWRRLLKIFILIKKSAQPEIYLIYKGFFFRIWTHSYWNCVLVGTTTYNYRGLQRAVYTTIIKKTISHQASSNAEGESISVFSGEDSKGLTVKNSPAGVLFCCCKSQGIIKWSESLYGLHFVSASGCGF